MSFDVNIGRSQPAIKAATGKNNDGGSSGNTGFMMRGRRKKEQNIFGSLFDEDKEDLFEFGSFKKDVTEQVNETNSWLGKLFKKNG